MRTIGAPAVPGAQRLFTVGAPLHLPQATSHHFSAEFLTRARKYRSHVWPPVNNPGTATSNPSFSATPRTCPRLGTGWLNVRGFVRPRLRLANGLDQFADGTEEVVPRHLGRRCSPSHSTMSCSEPRLQGERPPGLCSRRRLPSSPSRPGATRGSALADPPTCRARSAILQYSHPSMVR